VFGTDYPTVAEAEKRVYTPDFCPGCKTILSFRDSCVGFAWGKRGQRFATHAIKPDPVAAHRAASKSCAAAEGGQCKSMVRCSGRTYMDGYEGEGESASILNP
jgi:hypothetical protein